MIAAETLLAIYPQPPRVATMWDYLPGVDPSAWAGKTTEDIARDLCELLKDMPPDIYPRAEIRLLLPREAVDAMRSRPPRRQRLAMRSQARSAASPPSPSH